MAPRVNVDVFVGKKGESKKGFVARIKPKQDDLRVVLDKKGYIKTGRPHNMEYHWVILLRRTTGIIRRAADKSTLEADRYFWHGMIVEAGAMVFE